MIYDAERRKGSGPVLGVRPGSGRPGPFGTADGFGLDGELGQEAAELAREAGQAEAAYSVGGIDLKYLDWAPVRSQPCA